MPVAKAQGFGEDPGVAVAEDDSEVPQTLPAGGLRFDGDGLLIAEFDGQERRANRFPCMGIEGTSEIEGNRGLRRGGEG